jgi:hypothetical protein
MTQMVSPDGTVSYTNDDADQLTDASSGIPLLDESHSYDDNGNRTDTGYSTGANNRRGKGTTHNRRRVRPGFSDFFGIITKQERREASLGSRAQQ